jgi:plasmid stability protein
MASLIIRNLDETVKTALRVQAARNGRSMEEEARQVLRRALTRDAARGGLGSRIAGRFAAAGGVDITLPSRHTPRQPPTFRRRHK